MNFLLLFAVWVGGRVEGNEKRKKKKKTTDLQETGKCSTRVAWLCFVKCGLS